LNLLRWSLTALLLLPIAWRALVPWQRIAQRWPYLFALGLFGVGTFNSLQYLALVSSTPLNVTLVGASMPVWMLLVGALFFGERPRTAQMVGAALSLTGVAVVLGRGSLAVLRGVQLVPGDLYVLAAMIGWAFYSWLLARPPAHMRGAERPRPDQGRDWAGLLLVQTLFGLVAAGAFTAGEQALGAAPIRWSLGVALALLYISLGASVVAYRCWGLGVAEGGPTLAAIFVNLTPLFAALLSALLLGEWPQPYHAAAFALIGGGIAASVVLGRLPQKVPG
jgi:drug/metabolite transporter (DMT)-like permease